ncbi:MAG TPA: threonine/serine dehydratase [Candidatus Polarisedimenticolaceae bacterium]|nr:threonine/serine dehydratase [Candidatus Polarisedimenticolaceae bacterium]
MNRVELPSIERVREAAARIAPHVHRTPLVRSRFVDATLGAEVSFKCENLQKVGAFKARGATNAVFALSRDAARGGVVTHSSGNHGAALAYAAAKRGIPCVVVMPHDAPATKARAVRGYGAEIIACRRDEREQRCRQIVERRGMTLIHPYENVEVIAGQGTVALEAFEQTGPVDVIIAPVGGGGLIAGTTITAGAVSPATAVWAAEPRAVDDAYRSMLTGEHQPAVADPTSRADGLLTRLGRPAFAAMRQARVRVVVVSESELLQATWDVIQRMKQVIEPSAGTVLAALRVAADEIRGKRVIAILSGGNTDFSWLEDPSFTKD